ncbi:MAG: hypothetical protein JNN20_10070 [Betaproteobacteria bacterium]|nr:hypothetical protein [Betaproteobacteria bacterium]
MFGKGRRLFSIASVGLIVIAVMHLIGHLQAPPADLVTATLYAAMRSYEVDAGIGKPSMMNVLDSLSFGTSIMLAWMGLINLAIAKYVSVGERLIRTVCTLNIFATWTLVAAYAYYEVPPPAISLAIVAMLFTIARFRVRLSHPHL